jgi:hypothetical protein
LLLGLAITASLFAVLLHGADVRWLLRGLARLWSWWLVPIGVVYSGTYLLRALRLRLLLGKPVPFRDVLSVVALHVFLTRLLPLRTGEASHILLARRYLGAPLSLGAATLVVARALDMLSVALLFCLAALSGAGLGPGVAGELLLAATVAVVVLWRLDTILIAVGRAAPRLAFLSPRALRSGVSFLARMTEATQEMRRRGVYPAAWGASLTTWLLMFAMFHLVFRALHMSVAPRTVFCGSTASIVIAALPVNGVGGFGTTETGWALGFMALGMQRTTAITSAIAMNASVFVFSALYAALGWLLVAKRPPGTSQGPAGTVAAANTGSREGL